MGKKRSCESSVLNRDAMMLGWQLHLIIMMEISPEVLLLPVAHAQNQTQPTTDPSKVTSLNSVFKKWGISATPGQWNISGEPCSGAAINSTRIDDPAYNPLIKCDCSYDYNTTCHITQLGVRAMSVRGPIPDELWRLSYLSVLDLDLNVLTGSLSSFICNLTRLQQLSVNGNALSRELPKELGLLTNLNLLYFSVNNFSGSLPSEIGNLKNLEQLIFDGAGVGGEIPPTFANLKNLTTVWASDNELSGRIPDFIGNWSKLISLVLRNNNISDSISPKIAQFGKLTYLFLGNNSLNGTLQFEKSKSLSYLDVSYNSLMGSLPPWFNDQNSQFWLPSGLSCLQRSFPCNQGREIYYNFAIKCGGPSITSSSNIKYEGDEDSGPATFKVAQSGRWAVIDVGYLPDWQGSPNKKFTISTPSQIKNTSDPGLFQTARFSASSLRYYGFGLANGDYTVTLQFADIVNVNNGWRILGRRVFDIYVQGTRVSKDFNILKEAGGAALTAVKKTFPANVSSNYLEIHFFWAGKGTCGIALDDNCGPLVSAISATADFAPKKDHTGMIIGISAGVVMSSLLAVLLTFYVLRKRKRARMFEDEEFLGLDARPYTFSYAELKAATDDFNPNNKLGEGGFGPVFKGMLNDGRVIAVKQLSVASHQGKHQFVAEIVTISAVQHRNLVKLYGCCIDGEKRLLVYEYLENKSLDQALFGKRSLALDWATRFDICQGIARGIAYLHEESRLRVVHRDIKASNILLDSNLKPKISDFGLAKLYDDKKTHISTRVAGTIGYLAPEYAMRGHLTEKADVFAFGVVALEVVSGRPNSDTSLAEEKIYLLELAWNLHETNSIVDLVDSRLSEFHEEEMKRVAAVGLLCTQTSPALRPPMSRVVAMLSGDIEVPAAPARPSYLAADWMFNDPTCFLSCKSKDTIHYDTTFSASPVAVAEPISPDIASRPMLSDVCGEG